MDLFVLLGELAGIIGVVGVIVLKRESKKVR
jgi:hypothetical protein